MIESRWRIYSRRIIKKVLVEFPDGNTKACRKALREAYPFGERTRYPYKMWRSEVRRALGVEKLKRIPNIDIEGQLFGYKENENE